MNSAPSLPTCLTAEELQLHLTSYDSIELLAMGGMGAVFKARQITLDRPVAIKVLTHECASSLQFRQIFKCEAQVMAKLNHPNLASIYDYGEVNGMLYIVMQYIEGRSLHQAANGRAVAQNEAASIIAKISRALHHAHKAGILHRDIKPANVLIDSKVNPVVVDFGLAHHTEETTLKGDTVFGTPGYTAPEVLAPPYKADQRADVYSLGVLFHELLTGSLPQSPYLPPSRYENIDPRYDTVCMKALHPCAAMRYADAESFAKDLEKILAGKELSTSSLMSVATAHPSAAPTPLLKVVPRPSSFSEVPAVKSTPLPSLNKLSKQPGQAKSAMVALAACITFAIAVIALIYSSTGSKNPAPVASGGALIESTSVGR
ncbi:MAG: serine/threonine protein kinase [Akkermansiaceae bacterium]